MHGHVFGAGRRWAIKGTFLLLIAGEYVRRRLRARRPTLPLDHIQRRLDLLLTAMYGRPIPIVPVDVPPVNWIERTVRFLRRDPRARESTPSVDGETIHLPASLNARDGIEVAVARYRLLAMEQAERLTRGTATLVPVRDTLVRDLFLVREGASVDARITSTMPGMATTLADERTAALHRRPKIETLTRPERDVELLLREALSTVPSEEIRASHNPSDSLAWAREMAAKIRQGRGTYRGLPPATFWGTVTPARTEDASGSFASEAPPPPAGLSPPSNSTGWSASASHDAELGIAEDQSAPSVGTAPDPNAPPGEDDEESPMGDNADPDARERWGDLDGPEAVTGDRGVIFGDDSLQIEDDDQSVGLPGGISYDEWNADTASYVRRAVVVRRYEPEIGDELWATDVLSHHAALVRQIRQQFERLRARRTLLGRQRSGDDLDIAACVQAIVDRRIGEPPDDRLYADARPARRGLALSLLVDISGSTEAGVGGELRIVDIEKIALLLASQALDALGDLYAIHAFAGKNASNVKMITVKDFAERNGEMVKRRIAGLRPGGFTRLGAAIRHATHQLARQAAGHRLLLILSDGRPNDVGRYQGPYGVEDARQAIMEARASGVYPFCITVDAEASEYLPRIFGTAGHTILQRADQLPTALLRAVRALIRRP